MQDQRHDKASRQNAPNLRHKALRENLREASKEDRKEMITAYKEENKANHQEIKTQAQEVKEEIRSLVETEVTRTSDL